MKRIMILGAGAQGSTVAKRMDLEPGVGEILCADADLRAVQDLAGQLNKGIPLKLDASDPDAIARAARGSYLMVNALPMAFGRIALEAALRAEVHYQDFAAADTPEVEWVEGIRAMFSETGPRFEAVGKTALISTGSAPGLICVAARRAVRELDSCDSISLYVYEGVEARRFLPFWWSPQVAYQDMSDTAWTFENGELVPVEPFSRPVFMTFPGLDREVRLVEHSHDEPVHMGLHAREYFKGARNICFKYGGTGIEFAEPLYKMGMLSDRPVEVDGVQVIPRHLLLKLTPPAPKYREEIREILEEGPVSDTGVMAVHAEGLKGGEKVRVEISVSAPGCAEAFARSGLTGETYLTGQGGAIFTGMMVNGLFSRRGLFSSDMLDDGQVDYYLQKAAELDITLDLAVRPMKG